MEKFVIKGGNALKGEVRISGAKNAAVAILPAVLLSDEPCIVENLPNISDVATILKTMQALGANIKALNKSAVEIDPRHVNSFVVSKKMAEGMRASSYFLGALLGRLGSKFNINLTADDIIITSGGSEAVLFSFLSCLNPGDERQITLPPNV